jgi:hypothetical protein
MEKETNIVNAWNAWNELNKSMHNNSKNATSQSISDLLLGLWANKHLTFAIIKVNSINNGNKLMQAASASVRIKVLRCEKKYAGVEDLNILHRILPLRNNRSWIFYSHWTDMVYKKGWEGDVKITYVGNSYGE